MAGYSGTPLPKKLGIKEGHQVALLGAPPGFGKTLGKLPAGATTKREPKGKGPFDVIVLFVKRRSDLQKRFRAASKRLDWAGGLWVSWPKKSSGVKTDVDEGFVREHGLDVGLVDNKICAVDDVWSGLRFVYRVADRPKKKR